MQVPLQITFRHMATSPAFEARIRELAGRLERFHDRITSCSVVVEAPHQHHRQGQLYSVRVHVNVPGRELYADSTRDLHQAHEDPYVAARDAFDAIRRSLEELNRERQQQVKYHEPVPQGHIAELDLAAGHGRVETPEGRTLYFHRNSVKGYEFDKLTPGMLVEFEEGAGDDGPQCVALRVAMPTAA